MDSWPPLDPERAKIVESAHKLFNELVNYFSDATDPEWTAQGTLEIFDTFASNETTAIALEIARDMTLK